MNSPRISLVPHRVGGTDAELGTVRVPLRHAAPGGAGIQLRFVRLASRADAPGPPVVFLTGGPGLSGIRSGEGRLFPFFEMLRAESDVVLLDQRACVTAPGPERVALFPDDRVVTRDEYLAVISRTIARGAERLRADGIPVDALNTRESADDVAMLAHALYGDDARVALLGWSYGSHLAMAVIKQHQDVVASAVLAAPEGPDHTLKRPLRIQQHLERAVDADAVARILKRIDSEPVLVTVYSDRFYEGPPRDVVFGRFDLEWILCEALADTRMRRDLPGWVARMDGGDFSILGTERLMRNAWRSLRDELPYSVARYAMDCASGASAPRRALIEQERRDTLLGNTIDFPLPEICGAVGCPDLGDEFRAVPRSDVPVLFITGTLDCRTPAENVAELAPGFANHWHLVVDGAGHGDLLLAPVVQAGIAQFIATGRHQS